MAHFVQAVALGAVLFSVSLAGARGADFSHAEHLGYGVSCVQCHVSVTSSTRVEDNNLPKPEVCRGCHEDRPIKSPRVLLLDHFSHAQHTKTIDCQQCHSTVGGTFPAMATCVTCHEQGDMPNGCWKCHSKTMQLKPALHVNGFVDSHSRVKREVAEKTACRVCHGPNFRCAGCH